MNWKGKKRKFRILLKFFFNLFWFFYWKKIKTTFLCFKLLQNFLKLRTWQNSFQILNSSFFQFFPIPTSLFIIYDGSFLCSTDKKIKNKDNKKKKESKLNILNKSKQRKNTLRKNFSNSKSKTINKLFESIWNSKILNSLDFPFFAQRKKRKIRKKVCIENTNFFIFFEFQNLHEKIFFFQIFRVFPLFSKNSKKILNFLIYFIWIFRELRFKV